ncbi:MAG: efflux RND transporter periplasmic adaptor subunit, partial [Bacteroidota bacterium]
MGKRNTHIIHLILGISVLGILGLWGCRSDEAEGKSYALPTSASQVKWEKTEVRTVMARAGTFEAELFSNGKLETSRKAHIQFQVGGMIRSLPIRNGQYVKKGQLLAQLDDATYQLDWESAQQQLRKAEFEMRDVLLSFGDYAVEDSAEIPAGIWEAAQNKSGLREARIMLKRAQLDLAHTRLRAPFSGYIAQLNGSAFQPASQSKPLCFLIDPNRFYVSFPIMESELKKLEIGQRVQVMASGGKQAYDEGKITEIDPFVDENGAIQVKAKLSEVDKDLIFGMNVQVV